MRYYKHLLGQRKKVILHRPDDIYLIMPLFNVEVKTGISGIFQFN